jgi:ABC-type Fe3+/spermidine/putrescine transport system ATPase subunit
MSIVEQKQTDSVNKVPASSDQKNAQKFDLELRDLSVWYGDFQALRNVSISVQKGELFTLLGPSGSGKSTLLFCVAGFLPARSGTVLLAERDITSLPPNKREVGMVFQSYTLFPHKTVFQNIAYPLLLRKKQKDEIKLRVIEMLKLLHLETLESRFPHQLSGGQQQRVALARVLAFNPSLLLLDEPLGSVDRKLRIELQSEIRRVQRATKTTLIYVTHDQKEAMAISDRLAILRDGQIQQIGTPREIYDAPCNPFVADFFGSSNLLAVRIVAQDEHSCEVELSGCRIEGVPRPQWLTKTVERAVLMVRPEQWQIIKGSAGHPIEFSGEVEEVTFQGDSTVFQCRLKDQTRITVRRPDNGVADLNPKDKVCLRLDARKTKLFETVKGSHIC